MVKTNNPLFDTDVTKYLAQFKVPTFDVDALMVAHRKNLEALTAANQCAIEGVGALVRRQGEIARDAMESYTSAMRDLMAEGSTEEKAAKQADLTKRAYDKAVANTRELADMCAKTGNEAFGVINDRVREGLTEVQTLVASGVAQATSAAEQNANVAATTTDQATVKAAAGTRK